MTLGTLAQKLFLAPFALYLSACALPQNIPATPTPVPEYCFKFAILEDGSQQGPVNLKLSGAGMRQNGIPPLDELLCSQNTDHRGYATLIRLPETYQVRGLDAMNRVRTHVDEYESGKNIKLIPVQLSEQAGFGNWFAVSRNQGEQPNYRQIKQDLIDILERAK